jgi:hypothetical protein
MVLVQSFTGLLGSGLVKVYSDQVMRNTAHWARWFAVEWKNETPMRIHSSEIAADGSPEWHPDFVRWLTQEPRDRDRPRRQRDTTSRRTTQVMRRLRQYSIREYEVCYRVLMLGERLEETTEWLNARATRNAIPFPEHRPNGPHYTTKDALALLVAGVDYAREVW